jgi:hypothetical protein
MRPNAVIVLVAAAACGSNQPQARMVVDSMQQVDRWVTVAARDTVTVFVDTKTILRADTSEYGVWYRWLFATVQPGASQTRYRPFRVILQRADVDCHSLRLRMTELFFYADSGASEFIANEASTGSAWVAVPPASLGEAMVDSTCGLARSRALPIRRP